MPVDTDASEAAFLRQTFSRRPASPEWLLFGEPSSALAPKLVGEVLTVTQHLRRDDVTKLIGTREMGFAREGPEHKHVHRSRRASQ